jgi:transketolase
MDDYSMHFNDVQEMHGIMSDYKIKLPERNNMKFKETMLIIKQVRKKLDDALEAGEANEVKYKKELEKDAPKVDQEAEELTTKLEDEFFSDPESSMF